MLIIIGNSNTNDFSGLFAFWLLIAQFITWLGSMIIGVPVVLALYKLNRGTCLNAALSGGGITFLIMIGFNGPSLGWLSFIFVTYGFVCGYAFMHGYKKVEKHEKI